MEKFTWERFRTEKIAVWCPTEEKAKEFLIACKNYGLRFASGAPIGEVTHWEANGTSTVYTLRIDQPYIEVRSERWAQKHNYYVCGAHGVLVDLTAEERMRDVEAANCGTSKAPSPTVGTTPAATRPPAYWRDAEADKPMRDGEFIVCSVCVQDCEFMRRVQQVKYDLTNGWDYVEGEVITHWLDNAPSLPEVVVR